MTTPLPTTLPSVIFALVFIFALNPITQWDNVTLSPISTSSNRKAFSMRQFLPILQFFPTTVNDSRDLSSMEQFS